MLGIDFDDKTTVAPENLKPLVLSTDESKQSTAVAHKDPKNNAIVISSSDRQSENNLNTPLIISDNLTLRQRIGLFEFPGNRIKNLALDEKAFNPLIEHLTSVDRSIGSAYSEGDCFFDAFAQELINIKISIPFPDGENPSQSTHKNLRQFCNAIAKNLNSNLATNWIKEEIFKDARNTKDDKQDANSIFANYLAMIEFTASEIKERKNMFPDSTVIWGRSHIEGRMLCQVLGVRLHVVEVITLEDKVLLNHLLIDGQSSSQINEETARWIYSDNKTVHLAVYQGSLHFVPLYQQFPL